mgnify:FL=1
MNFLNNESVSKILGRNQHEDLVDLSGRDIRNKKILITGSQGSLGQELIKRLGNNLDVQILSTDITGDVEFMDVTKLNQVTKIVKKFSPDLIFHLAGAKHAPVGEVDTKETFEINTIGTNNMLESIDKKTKFILASTCKAANPEVVYGASKLIAERMVLNHGGSVARFFNVIETAGNVFEIWSKIPKDEPIDVAAICERHFISVSEAVGLLIFSSISQPGRYAVNSSALIKISEIAERLFPNREKNIIEPRRGDRISEKFLASSESIEKYLLSNTIIKVKSIHDYL